MNEFFCKKECNTGDCSDCESPKDKRIGLHVRHLSNYIKKTIDLLAQDSEITGIQSFLLGFLVRESEKRDLYQKDVEKYLKISKASVTSLLQQMEKKECIRRESVEGDARLKRIVVTPKGQSINENIMNHILLLENSMSKDISEQELRIFFSVISKIAKNLDDTCQSLTEKKE